MAKGGLEPFQPPPWLRLNHFAWNLLSWVCLNKI